MKRRFDVALVAGLLALLGAAPPSSRAQPDGEDVPTIGLALMGHISTFSNDIIEIAPMTSAGNPVPGRYGPLNTSNDIFNSILQRAGITPGVSSPNSLESSEGFLEAIEESQVVNKGGRRATFGYFIRAREGASRSEVDENYSTRTNEFFLLFSYDWVRADEKILYAFEVFLFGPMQATGCLSGSLAEPVPREQEVEDPPRLLAGLAVGAQVSTRDGNRYRLLQEVPLEIARVSNYKGERDHENETVKPASTRKGRAVSPAIAAARACRRTPGPFPGPASASRPPSTRVWFGPGKPPTLRKFPVT